jgi:hypothetical protein
MFVIFMTMVMMLMLTTGNHDDISSAMQWNGYYIKTTILSCVYRNTERKLYSAIHNTAWLQFICSRQNICI